MVATNLLNMYICEELQETLSIVILNIVFSLVISSEKPFFKEPAFFATLTNSLLNKATSIDSFKRF